jgi:hypothetical protein
MPIFLKVRFNSHESQDDSMLRCQSNSQADDSMMMSLSLRPSCAGVSHAQCPLTSATCNYKNCDMYFETSLVATLPLMSNIAHFVVACSHAFNTAWYDAL